VWTYPRILIGFEARFCSFVRSCARHEAMYCIRCLLVKELPETLDWHIGAVEGSSLRVDWYLPTFRYNAVPSSTGSSKSLDCTQTAGSAVGRLFQLDRFSCWTENDKKV
jgi:hypothetical protein